MARQNKTVIFLWLRINHLCGTHTGLSRGLGGGGETDLGRGLMAVGYGIDERVEVESGEVRVLSFDEDDGGGVVPGEVDMERQAVVEEGEGDTVLCADRLPDDDLVDVIELIPILFSAAERKNANIVTRQEERDLTQ